MWSWFADALRAHPELAIFGTLALGFFVGRLKFKSVSLGAVTGTLLAGVLVGQLDIAIPDLVKTVAFIGFLFALGYHVGPQLFSGLRKDGAPQVIIAVIGAIVGLAVAFIMAKVMGYGPGWGAGLLAGGLTQSAVIGVATDAINGSTTIPQQDKQTFINQIPVGYAVCYLFGTAAAAYFLSRIAPRLLGSRDLAADSAAMERELGTFDDPDSQPAYRQVVRRTYRITQRSELDGTTVAAEEELAASRGRRIFIQRYRRGDRMEFTSPDTVLRAGDVVTVTASNADFISGHMSAVGEEVDDPELLGYDIEALPIVVTVFAIGSVADTSLIAGAAENAHTLDDPGLPAFLATAKGTFIVCGSGLTGVEAATEIAEAYPHLRVTLVGRAEPAAMMGDKARAYVRRAFDRLGVTTRSSSSCAPTTPRGAAGCAAGWPSATRRP